LKNNDDGGGKNNLCFFLLVECWNTHKRWFRTFELTMHIRELEKRSWIKIKRTTRGVNKFTLKKTMVAGELGFIIVETFQHVWRKTWTKFDLKQKKKTRNKTKPWTKKHSFEKKWQ
jgi:hypothetical protein